MSLFIRVQTNFWNHRKTLKLRSLIGESALWIVPRLWSYAAENQPDGDFSKYSAEELALLLGYTGNAQAMLQALQTSGFIEGMAIHDWEEHNGYHRVFSERARKAANARWTGEEKKGQDKNLALRQASPSNATSIDGFEEFWKSYPRRVGKGNAEKAWKKLGCGNHLPLILTTVRAAKISPEWTKEGGQFIPHPATWLNRQGWHDEFTLHTNGATSHQPGAYHAPSSI